MCKPNVGAFGRDPDDVRDREQPHAAAILQHDAVEILLLEHGRGGRCGARHYFRRRRADSPRAHVGEQRLQSLQHRVGLAGTREAGRASECDLEPLVAVWLEQIVDRVRVEGTERVLVVRRHEHDCRCACVPHGVSERGDDAEAVDLRHLNVEEDDVDGLIGRYCGT